MNVNWRHRIAVVVLFVLAALPLAGTICAMTCLSASTTVAGHHGDGQNCEQAASPSSDASAPARIVALSDYDCGLHEGTLPTIVTTVAQRADLAVIAAQAASDPVHPMFGSVTAFGAQFPYTPPPDSAPPTTTPLVLRV